MMKLSGGERISMKCLAVLIQSTAGNMTLQWSVVRQSTAVC